MIPRSIQDRIGNCAYQLDSIGRSGSSVLLFPDSVLKILPRNEASRRSAELLHWLQGKIPVPEVLAWEESGEDIFLLMSKVPGEMACAETYLRQPRLLVSLLAQGMQRLWDVDICNCPIDQRLDRKLQEARYRVSQGLVDMDDAQPDTFGPNGFRDPADLLRWLETHRPEEELALSHGDYCLPNVFFDQAQFSGFIDLDRCGIADKWFDIAICLRSLRSNFDGTYGGPCYPGLDEGQLFRELGLEPDEEKLRYYILLDELF